MEGAQRKLANPSTSAQDKILQFKLALQRLNNRPPAVPVPILVIDLEAEEATARPEPEPVEELELSDGEHDMDAAELCSVSMDVDKENSPLPGPEPEEESESEVELLETLTCEKCEEEFQDETDYAGHTICHGANGDYTCLLCDYSVMTAEDLDEHKKVHSKRKENAVTSTTSDGQSNPRDSGRKRPMRRREAEQSSSSRHRDGQSPTSSASCFSLPRYVAGSMQSCHTSDERRTQAVSCLFLKIQFKNIMSLKDYEFDMTMMGGIVKLQGSTEAGKSAFICALMLVLGYDLAEVHGGNQVTMICGLHLSNVINDGEENGWIKLVLSLNCFPELEQRYGKSIQIKRTFSRESGTEEPTFLITSLEQPHSGNPAESLPPKLFLKLLRKLGFSPSQMRLVLLDEENMKFFVDNTDSWYSGFEHAAKTSIRKLRQEASLVVSCLRCNYNSLLPCLQRKIQQYCQDMDETVEEMKRQITKDLLLKMTSAFQTFLMEINRVGNLVISTGRKQMACCVRPLGSPDVVSPSLDEVKGVWETMTEGMRNLAVMGLYLCFWEILEVPLFAADAFSHNSTDFNLPIEVSRLLVQRAQIKCAEGKQFVISLPDGI